MGDYIRRARTAGLSWPLPERLDERALEARLFPVAPVSPRVERVIPDWAQVHAERRRKGVTLALLWQEYKAEHPEGLQYSQFCERYRAWRQRLDVVMRQTHRAGEKLFVDYAGHRVPVVERVTGELRKAPVFVAVLGASNYTFAEADLDPGAARLVRLARAGAAVLSRRPGAGDSGQSRRSGHTPPSLRARRSPHLHRPRRALRLRHPPRSGTLRGWYAETWYTRPDPADRYEGESQLEYLRAKALRCRRAADAYRLEGKDRWTALMRCLVIVRKY